MENNIMTQEGIIFNEAEKKAPEVHEYKSIGTLVLEKRDKLRVKRSRQDADKLYYTCGNETGPCAPDLDVNGALVLKHYPATKEYPKACWMLVNVNMDNVIAEFGYDAM